jgi:ABC-2 type transport system ATP-binding protein
MSAVIDVAGLRKTYRGLARRRVALDGLTLRVEAGQVHGLLGPNGSGKTTALRALLGLVRPDAGHMRLLGHPVPRMLPAVAPRVGAVLENPRFFGNLSGRRTLQLLAIVGGVPAARVDEALDLVGLAERAGDPVHAYSPGMTQRLAIAAAVLKLPELLILDEPTDRLDPVGIRQVRDLIRELAAGGATVLVASQLLSEIEQTCDTVTIIVAGRRIASGPVPEALADHDRGEFRVRVSDQQRAMTIIAETGLPVTAYEDHLIVGDLADAAWISRTLGRHGLWVSELTPLAPNLEQVFLDLTGGVPAPRTPGEEMAP